MLKIFLEFGLICFKREERKIENVSELVMCAPNLFHSLITDGIKIQFSKICLELSYGL